MYSGFEAVAVQFEIVGRIDLQPAAVDRDVSWNTHLKEFVERPVCPGFSLNVFIRLNRGSIE